MKNAILLAACCAMLAACNSPRAASTGMAGTDRTGTCPTTGVPPVHFYGSKFPGEEMGMKNIPKKYDSYTVDAGEWRAFAQKVKERGPGEVTGLNIPLPGACKNFSVTVSSTMSPELAAKYPDLISLKGNADDGADLRLDWDGKQMRGQVILRGDTWFMEPYVTGAQIFYLVYHKADASATKKPFE